MFKGINRTVRFSTIGATFLAGILLHCMVPVNEDNLFSELESVWQHLQVHSIYQWKDSTWVPPDPFVYADPAALMAAIPDTLHGDHFTKYGVATSFGSNRSMVSLKQTAAALAVTLDTLTDSTVYVRIPEFVYKRTAGEFLNLLPAVAAFPNIIIDVRKNGGGYIDQVQPVIDAFLPQGVPYIRAREREYDEATRTARTVDHFWETKQAAASALVGKRVVVMMDRSSASASEILIVALKERLDATLVGERSYGKGIGQVEISRRGDNRKGMKITYLQLSGISKIGNYHRVGIDPDVPLHTFATEEDSLLATVKILEPTITVLKASPSLRKITVTPAGIVERSIEEE